MATRKRRVRRSAEEAQRRILDAAEKRLREGGPEAVRLQDIARDVGISHPAILHHFASRDGLTQALERRAMDRLETELVQVLSSQPAQGGTAVDVIDGELTLIFGAGTPLSSDNVDANDVPFLSSFPYLAPPN